jgi:SPP1 gp7 family putative phage head morphogenesis protein
MENTLSFGFDWTLANEKASEWVSKYSLELIRDIDETGRRRTQQALQRWISNGEALEWLINDLEPVFGRRRATMIATTEVTRSYAEATRISYRESGVVKKLIWQTANDERRCVYCGALHGKTVGIDGKFSDTLPARLQESLNGRTFEIPPAHPLCRCWISAEVI